MRISNDNGRQWKKINILEMLPRIYPGKNKMTYYGITQEK